MARHVLLVKSHVDAFTRKDGTFVAAHDDKRVKAADFHSKETDYHMGAEVRASREEFPSGEKLHQHAAAAHEAAMKAHKSGSPDAHELTSAAVAASKKADDVFDRKKKAEAPDGLLSSEKPKDSGNIQADSPSTSSAYVSRFSTLESAKRYQSNNAKPTKVFHHPEGGFFVPPHARSSSTYEKAGHKVALHYNGKPPAPDDVKKPSSILVKSHVSAFTRKDGVFVAAHDDKRTASSASPAPQPRTARPKNPAARSYSGSGAGGMDHDSPAPAPAADNAQPRVARPANKSARAYSGRGSTPANADTNQKDWGKLPDDDNPTYAMRGLESTHLGHIASGKVDAKRIAHDELASRGQDSDGKWIGFDKAKAHHDAIKGKGKAHPSNARVAEHMQSVGSDILSSAVKGHIDLGKRADAELANRNHDRSGNWIKK